HIDEKVRAHDGQPFVRVVRLLVKARRTTDRAGSGQKATTDSTTGGERSLLTNLTMSRAAVSRPFRERGVPLAAVIGTRALAARQPRQDPEGLVVVYDEPRKLLASMLLPL